MKTKKFENIKKLAKEASASVSALDQVVGGYLPTPALFRCSCSWGANPPYVSSWVNYYVSTSQMYSDISRMCRNGQGGCSRIG